MMSPSLLAGRTVPDINVQAEAVLKCFIIAYKRLSNSYSMGCPPVRGDNPRALASGLSYV